MNELDTLVKDTTIESWGIDPERYDADATFAQLGADSLDVIELFMAVEEKLGLSDIPESAAIHTPNDLVAYLREQTLADA